MWQTGCVGGTEWGMVGWKTGESVLVKKEIGSDV